MAIKYFIICLFIFVLSTKTSAQEVINTEETVLLNMVHHNPGEPLFKTDYTRPTYIKSLGYTGQCPKIHVQCAITYDDYDDGVVPDNTPEKLWIERHAAGISILIDNAKRAKMPLYPFTDMLVVPKSVMEKYGSEMKINGKISILKNRTKDIVRAQVKEIFTRFPNLDGLTVRHGETYLHDAPYHFGSSPAATPEEHSVFINLLKEEICIKRNKVLIYRTWDFGNFHTKPDFYIEATKNVIPHPNLFISIKNTNGDFLRDVPLNKTIGLGNLQQIVEISINQAGIYGRNAHPYYIGKGVIEGWPEMKEKKGIRDVINKGNIRGFWTWTWGDGWYGPYFGNEFWMKLNEYVIREYIKNPTKTEKQIFEEYALKNLGMDLENTERLRELCEISVDAVFKGQATSLIRLKPWWIRDHFFTAVDLSSIVKMNKQKEFLLEKKENLKRWYKMEQISKDISMPNKEDEQFVKVSTTYGRIKYELIELIFRTQVLLAEIDSGNIVGDKEAKDIIDLYSSKWDEWIKLKKQNPSCPTLYVDYDNVHCGRPPFKDSIERLNQYVKR